MASMSAPKKPKSPNANALNVQAQKKSATAKTNQDSCSCGMQECSMSAQEHRKSRANVNGGHTKIVVKCNCGFPNNLYIRGEGIKGLSWDKGTLMKCTKDDEWVWETDVSFNHGKIKVLINDKQYEMGENHEIDCGNSITFAPRF